MILEAEGVHRAVAEPWVAVTAAFVLAQKIMPGDPSSPAGATLVLGGAVPMAHPPVSA
jgi:hypothetical protein